MSQEEDNDAALAHIIIPDILLFVRKYCVKNPNGETGRMYWAGPEGLAQSERKAAEDDIVPNVTGSPLDKSAL